MKTETASKFFPFFHWLATLILAPFIDALISSDHKMMISVDNYLVVLLAALVTAFPALVIYIIIYHFARKGFVAAWQFKVFLVVMAIVLMIVSLEIFDRSVRKDYGPAFGLAIIVTSFFLPVSLKPRKS
jgi:hypothetical protein